MYIFIYQMGKTRHDKLIEMFNKLKKIKLDWTDDELAKEIILACGSDRITFKGALAHIRLFKMVEEKDGVNTILI